MRPASRGAREPSRGVNRSGPGKRGCVRAGSGVRRTRSRAQHGNADDEQSDRAARRKRAARGCEVGDERRRTRFARSRPPASFARAKRVKRTQHRRVRTPDGYFIRPQRGGKITGQVEMWTATASSIKNVVSLFAILTPKPQGFGGIRQM